MSDIRKSGPGLPQPLRDPPPLFVWDTKILTCQSAFAFRYPETATWWREHMPEHGKVWRAEFYIIDVPFVVCYPYKTENGKILQGQGLDPEMPLLGDPYPVPLRELPEERLRKGCPWSSSPGTCYITTELQEARCYHWTLAGSCPLGSSCEGCYEPFS